MARSIRQFVRERAGFRCEYCHHPDHLVGIYDFHVEHIVAKQHGGKDAPENLAWSCERCNAFKGPNLSGIDPLTENIVPLFHPRRQRWSRHFEWYGAMFVGRTQTGRATVALLEMNNIQRVELREFLIENDLWFDDSE